MLTHAHVVLVGRSAFSERGYGAGLQQLVNSTTATIANTLGTRGAKVGEQRHAQPQGPQDRSGLTSGKTIDVEVSACVSV